MANGKAAERIEVRAGESPGATMREGDEVRWRDPKSGEEWSGLVVEFLWAFRGSARVYGHFGSIRPSDGGEVRVSRIVQLEDCAVTRRRGEGV